LAGPALGTFANVNSGFATVIVIAKAPIPGRVKTRLVPPFTSHEAAQLAAAAIADTLRAAALVPAATHLLVLDGRADALGVAIDGWTVIPQVDGGLDARLVAAFAAADPDGPAVLVGMDTPQLRPGDLTAFDPARFDAGLGLASDGGYWTIGFRDPAHAAATIADVPMSRSDTGALQLARLRAAGLRVQLLDELSDVDTYADAQLVAALAPSTAFGRAFAALTPTGPVTADAGAR
jgi:glycosyltransferase A (GT-A) superfamily protein (DUF2064 family)